jgi:hypothetical protein
MYELNKLGVKGEDLFSLRQNGEIWYDDSGNFKVLKNGPLDLSLLEKTRKWKKITLQLTDLHEYMKKQLLRVSIDESLENLPAYFKAFMTYRKSNLSIFFSVDGFSGRVHTPVVNLKGVLRGKLRLDKCKLCSLDVKQMQPTILAKVLEDAVGKNSFSDAIGDGKDVYLALLEQNVTLTDREQAKKSLYQLIFGKPMDDIGRMFRGDTRWVSWINEYKSRKEERNPHGRETHTNLAWLLQSEEVKAMTRVWNKLMEEDIPFLSIHDELLVKRKDKDRAYSIFCLELKEVFKKFEVTVQCY